MSIFNNRELASATLVVVFFLWISIKSPDVRSSLRFVVCAFFKKPIIISLIVLLGYILLVVIALLELGVWNIGQLKNTILWFVFIGFVQLMNTSKIEEPINYLKNSLNSQLKLIVLVEFLVAFHSYSYFVELILVAVIAFLVGCSTFSENKPEYQLSKKIFDVSLTILGSILLIISIVNIYDEPTKFFSIATFRDFLVPMLLSICLLPYIYCFYYFLSYERAFVKTRIYTESKQLQRYAKVRSFIVFRGNPKIIHQWLLWSCVPEFESRSTISDSIERFKKEQCETTV